MKNNTRIYYLFYFIQRFGHTQDQAQDLQGPTRAPTRALLLGCIHVLFLSVSPSVQSAPLAKCSLQSPIGPVQALIQTPLGYAIVSVSHGNSAVILVQDLSLCVLQQIKDGAAVRVGPTQGPGCASGWQLNWLVRVIGTTPSSEGHSQLSQANTSGPALPCLCSGVGSSLLSAGVSSSMGGGVGTSSPAIVSRKGQGQLSWGQ